MPELFWIELLLCILNAFFWVILLRIKKRWVSLVIMNLSALTFALYVFEQNWVAVYPLILYLGTQLMMYWWPESKTK